MLETILTNAIFDGLHMVEYQGITYIGLPKPQRTGSITTQRAYAGQAARTILANINDLGLVPVKLWNMKMTELILTHEVNGLHYKRYPTAEHARLSEDIVKRRTYNFVGN